MPVRNDVVGYWGPTHLLSPSGDSVEEVVLPERRKLGGGKLWVRGEDHSTRRVRRFHRLLSDGWKVITQEGAEAVKDAASEWKKGTDRVIGTTLTGDQSHGGDHESGEVKDRPKRGDRGGQRRRRAQKPEPPASMTHWAGQHGKTGVFSPQPLKVSAKSLMSAQKSAELLAELAGRSSHKIQGGTDIDIEELLMALETGDDPIPALERPAEIRKIKVVVTPDCSGSTQGWSGIARAWALLLSEEPNVDVFYAENSNGYFWSSKGDNNSEMWKLLPGVDLMIYLGDTDGVGLCEDAAKIGLTVVALDSACCNYGEPRIKHKNMGAGTLSWVDRVSAKDSGSWYKALQLVLGE